MNISSLKIENFKSIKKLELETKRVNIFVGEPNSGKTNIIEALTFLSINAMDEQIFKDIFRFESLDDLFPDSNISNAIRITTNQVEFSLEFHKNEKGALMNDFESKYIIAEKPNHTYKFYIGFDGNLYNFTGEQFISKVCFYQYKKIKQFQKGYRPFLNPPFGDNIPGLLLNNEDLKILISDIFRERGFKFELKPKDSKLSIGKDIQSVIYSYPYSSASETLQRIVFMILAIESNKDMTLLFDEPEANTFPFYTNYIAERIGLNDTNQYFLTTHNPYLLMSLIEKTPSKDLNVIVTRMENFETKCRVLEKKQIEMVLDLGYEVYFNLDKFFN